MRLKPIVERLERRLAKAKPAMPGSVYVGYRMLEGVGYVSHDGKDFPTLRAMAEHFGPAEKMLLLEDDPVLDPDPTEEQAEEQAAEDAAIRARHPEIDTTIPTSDRVPEILPPGVVNVPAFGPAT